jgi:WD40 repeat protein
VRHLDSGIVARIDDQEARENQYFYWKIPHGAPMFVGSHKYVYTAYKGRIWDIETGKIVREIFPTMLPTNQVQQYEALQQVAISKSGNVLARYVPLTDEQNQVYHRSLEFYDISTGEVIASHILINDNDVHLPRTLSPDGQYVLVDQSMYRINRETKQLDLIRDLELSDFKYNNPDYPYNAAKFSQDSQYLITTVDAHYTILWDVQTASEVFRDTVPGGGGVSVGVSPNLEYYFRASKGGYVHLYKNPNLISSVSEEERLLNPRLSPNPVREEVHVSFEMVVPTELSFTLTSMDGKSYRLLVQTFGSGVQSVSISLSEYHLVQGEYILSITDTHSNRHISSLPFTYVQ